MMLTIDKNNIPVTVEDYGDKYILKIGYNNYGIEIGSENSLQTHKQMTLQDIYNLENNLKSIIKHIEMEEEND